MYEIQILNNIITDKYEGTDLKDKDNRKYKK